MFIQTEATPNPNTLKFLPGQSVLGDGTAFFTDEASAARSPLAAALFTMADVRAVFYGSDFITVTKKEDAVWEVMKPQILSAISEHYVSGAPLIAEAGTKVEKATREYSAEEQEIVEQIKELIETRVRPAVAMDGGDIIFHAFEDGIVKLEMHGACSGCPSSTATLKSGIENMLKHYVPEVVAVEAV
jgi:Fe-S cluster biogenesis protein NfuA